MAIPFQAYIMGTIAVLFLSVVFMSHYFKNQRVKELGFKYDVLNVEEEHPNKIICVLDITTCHWCYLLVRDLWRSPLVKQYLEQKNIELLMVDPKDGVQFVRHNKFPHFSQFPCSIFLDKFGQEVKRQYGVFGFDTLKENIKYIFPE
ncbi:Conserved_hypothetical protein [Hexamita inflata]|uniref:Thioredoxin domain-containing protein n=1 Tax=Hexamita inflata TaxID=28002 RepID=A0AA86UBM0_9EUKA|nr:Conserved hypothetical protein [Hexamita inflata]